MFDKNNNKYLTSKNKESVPPPKFDNVQGNLHS